MNVSLLDDEEYLDYLSVNILKWKLEGEKELSDKRCIWDWIQQEYEEATQRFEKDPNDYNRSQFNEIKEKLELFYEEKTNGIIVRARARWHEH